MNPKSLTRRELLWSAAGIAAGLSTTPRSVLRAADRSSKIVDRQAWAFLQELSDGIWAAVSTPLVSSDWTTGSNGGLIAGGQRVLAIEGFLQPAGSRWLAEQSRKLTGRWPSDVLITHFHGDHANGLEGYASVETPTVWLTRTTLDLIRQDDAQREEPPSETRLAMLEGATLIDPDSPTELDLGGLTANLHPRRGHTASDVTVELDEPSLVFAGDLVWNERFPNYRDTEASNFSQSIRDLRRTTTTTYIAGHGGLADDVALGSLLTLVDSVEEAARLGRETGLSAEQAAAEYRLPPSLSDWLLFNPRYFEVAFQAWYRELE